MKLKDYSKGYQPIDNGKGKPNPPGKKKSTEETNMQKYRLVELRDINRDFGTPFWRIQSYHEYEQKWITYGNEDYSDYETAKRCYDIVIGKVPRLKVMKETEVEV